MKITKIIRNGFLKFFGDVKVFKFPMFILYDPGSYFVKGNEIRNVIENIKAGDILVRGYNNYLDGYFIPGFFSHAALFLGEVWRKNILLPEILAKKFVEGSQVVIHAMAEGVFMEDIISFCKCDYLLILRRSSKIESPEIIESSFGVIYDKAIENLGKPYDFDFNFSEYSNLCCTELVYKCCESFINLYDVKIKKRKLLFKKMDMITPDDFVTDKFEIVFKSSSISDSILNKIIQTNKY